MKLIDLLVQELPKRGGWPDGVDAVEQDSEGQLFEMESDYCSDFKLKKCDDWIADVVTKQQYESALAASQNPTWNGEGMPPVGCECECQFLDAWHVCKVLFIGAEVIVGVIDGSERAFSVSHTKFQPPQSEADRKRNAAVEAIDYWLPEYIPDTPNEFYHAKKIYDAIAAGKIPGVKLDD